MRYIAFLRGINVSGQKLIKMDMLKQYFEMPGMKNIVTYIQSGNILFDTREADEEKLRKKIEKQLLSKLGYAVPTVLRTLEEIKTAISNNPFDQSDKNDTRKLYVVFMSDTPPADLHSSLDTFKQETEALHIIGRELYILTGGIGNSKLNLNVIEKKLRTTATMRNWATVNKVLEL